MTIDLTGVTALVTGASSGIGEAIAETLAGSGAAVAIHCNRGIERAEALARRIGGGAGAFRADLSDPDEASRLFGDVASRMGRIHMLVNNAGIFEPSPPESGHGEWMLVWERTLAINLTAAGVLCREAIEHFRREGGGRIVHIASRAAFRGETREYLAYAASKGGMVSLSRSIARSFGKDGIVSIAIAPGYVRTPMTAEYLDEHEGEMVEKELSLDRMTLTGDVAPLVAFIASGSLDHATGCTIDINGGSYIH
jgi:3-oxoacyl-[acyl-carrier protein] reductase